MSLFSSFHFAQLILPYHDEYGNRTSMTYPDGRVVSYTYDRMNRMTGVTGLDGELTTYTYDAAGRRTETSGSTLTLHTAMTAWGIWWNRSRTGKARVAFSYAYDRNGYITGEIRRGERHDRGRQLCLRRGGTADGIPANDGVWRALRLRQGREHDGKGPDRHGRGGDHAGR